MRRRGRRRITIAMGGKNKKNRMMEKKAKEENIK
jgi:hypothetical protein